MPRQLSTNERLALKKWLANYEITSNKLNREFSDAVGVAHLLKKIHPKGIDLHNYPSRNNTQLKINNWETLHFKILGKLGIQLSKSTYEKLARGTDGAMDWLLFEIMILDRTNQIKAGRGSARGLETRSRGYVPTTSESSNALNATAYRTKRPAEGTKAGGRVDFPTSSKILTANRTDRSAGGLEAISRENLPLSFEEDRPSAIETVSKSPSTNSVTDPKRQCGETVAVTKEAVEETMEAKTEETTEEKTEATAEAKTEETEHEGIEIEAIEIKAVPLPPTAEARTKAALEAQLLEFRQDMDLLVPLAHKEFVPWEELLPLLSNSRTPFNPPETP